MIEAIKIFMDGVSVFFLLYLLVYASYLFLSVTVGAYKLYKLDKMRSIKNELKHDYYFPISILVPAHNEEVTILDSVRSLLNLKYKLYEIIVVDDGSNDSTSQVLIDYFHMRPVDRPIRKAIPCQPQEVVYGAVDTKVKLTLIRKKNGGKGDALNMGINASRFPYFICMDADSILQSDSLERIIQPVMEDDKIIAVGGQVRVAQCVELSNDEVRAYHLPWNPLLCMQVMEYDRTFLASRILLDSFNGNLIISGAFGLFKKEIVIAAGGYDSSTLGEDMELVVRLHSFCRSNNIPYSIRYEPNAVCWSQAPATLSDLKKQRRRWHLGLFQSLMKHRNIFFSPKFGLVGTISYLYYLLYELLFPPIEIFGVCTMILAWYAGILNVPFMIHYYLLYAIYGVVLTMTAFFQRIYTQHLNISVCDVIKACVMCVVENVFFRLFLDYVRATSFIGYRKRKTDWGHVRRYKQKAAAGK